MRKRREVVTLAELRSAAHTCSISHTFKMGRVNRNLKEISGGGDKHTTAVLSLPVLFMLF